jgi:uncharacterized Ntn-hydrolase superfamily protein
MIGLNVVVLGNLLASVETISMMTDTPPLQYQLQLDICYH